MLVFCYARFQTAVMLALRSGNHLRKDQPNSYFTTLAKSSMILNRRRGYRTNLRSAKSPQRQDRSQAHCSLPVISSRAERYCFERGNSLMKSSPIRFIIFSLMALALGSMLLVACQRPGTPTASSGGSSSSSSSSSGSSSTSSCPTVHMTDNNFAQSSVTLSKGCTLTLTDDAAVTHIIMNGSWVNGNAEPKQEPGAPSINMTFTGNDTQSTPAWNTPGTYHLYCTIHPGMNLTVIVQ